MRVEGLMPPREFGQYVLRQYQHSERCLQEMPIYEQVPACRVIADHLLARESLIAAIRLWIWCFMRRLRTGS
jgi:hypothetical protein